VSEQVWFEEGPTVMVNILAGWQQLTGLLAGRTRAPRSERGASVVEYALLVALIVIVCVVAIQFLGTSTSSSISNTGSLINP
jgi:pilus assembly protein Flp/PilA